MRILRAIFILCFSLTIISLAACGSAAPRIFDGARAHRTHVIAQTNFGARPTGSPANHATGDYILAQLTEAGWKTETQEFAYRGVPIRNIVGKQSEGRGPLIILGAHYDTRARADQDKTDPNAPVLGANDGASGVAVLLELARVLDRARLKNEVWLVFFDAEDNGDLNACALIAPPCDETRWQWSIGAAYFAAKLNAKPEFVVIADMIGDAEQNIYYEQTSDKALQEELWKIAARLGYTREFIPEFKWAIEDDHTPFLFRGIRAAVLIDFDYPYWHTTQDTVDKVSGASLERVGRVLQTWLENK
ncbi:MAG: M28 family peptidase [Chloroflexi bacterium]|nr:M28 family peptidase [Chloroflexota bacterium]